jgi:malate dehydrogenase (oxaloacetate-decarboxylating)
LTKDSKLAQTDKASQEAIKLHSYYRGKIQTVPRCAVRSIDDFAIWYTPGVAVPCRAIEKNKDLAYDYTLKGNTIAVVSDGTRVLGLGNIGPEAGLPVMEGKALLFKYLGGVDCVPICLDTTDPDEFIKAVKYLQPSFGGINLEDIEQPKCFYILERLRQEMSIPVWHDDQQGTAAVTVAGMINAAKVVGKEFSGLKIVLIGAGAANTCVAQMLIKAGAKPGNLIMVDSKGTLHKDRTDIEAKKEEFKQKWEICLTTNARQVTGGAAEALQGADAVVALSKPGPGTVSPDWIKNMAPDAIVFACANPTPEIWPWEAKQAGARIVATGRSDFPNQVNNSLIFPGLFRGVLDVRAQTITDEMCIAAARALAGYEEAKGTLSEDNILPSMDELEVFAAVAAAVGTKAMEQGVARINRTHDEIFAHAKTLIEEVRTLTDLMMKQRLIPPALME